MKRKPTVAIVGRPNVGKSTLFNKIAGRRVSIVDDTPGVTRDRIYMDAEWNGLEFTIVDTGGIEPVTDDIILRGMREQAQLAIDMCDVIVFLTDIRSGVTANDKDIASMLQKSGKPLILCVNKIDSPGELPADFYEFYELGFGDPVAISSLHGSGTGDLLDKICELLPTITDDSNRDSDAVRVAIIGKPNVGKSSLINKIIGENRVIVSDIPGTTRDSIDQSFQNQFGNYVLVDTAGIRRQNKVTDNIEKYSVLRAKNAVENADVCIVLIDASQGATSHDERIAGIAHEAGKPVIIAVNKWDLIEKENSTFKEFTDKLRASFAYMDYAEIIFISAKTGQRLNKLFELINNVHAESSRRISTGSLNDVLADAVARAQPPTNKGRRLKIYYMTQTGTNPPNFVMFVNDSNLFHFSYVRYIENRLRETFGFKGTPMRFVIKNKTRD